MRILLRKRVVYSEVFRCNERIFNMVSSPNFATFHVLNFNSNFATGSPTCVLNFKSENLKKKLAFCSSLAILDWEHFVFFILALTLKQKFLQFYVVYNTELERPLPCKLNYWSTFIDSEFVLQIYLWKRLFDNILPYFRVVLTFILLLYKLSVTLIHHWIRIFVTETFRWAITRPSSIWHLSRSPCYGWRLENLALSQNILPL